MILLAIDPGVHSGFARFEDCQLVSCGIWDEIKIDAHIVVIEKPVVYHRQKGDPNDLIDLAIRVGQYAERARNKGARCNFVKPSEWKGQVPKKIHHNRIIKELEDEELEIVGSAATIINKSIFHNVMDAVGIGLYCRRIGMK